MASPAPGILGAVEARFPQVVTGLTGGLWLGQVPEQIPDPSGSGTVRTPLPCGCLKHLGEQTEWTFEDAYVDEGAVAFVLFERGAAAVEALAKQVRDGFAKNWGLIQVQGGEVVSFLRTRYLVDAEEERAADGEQVYRAEVEYQYRVTGTIP